MKSLSHYIHQIKNILKDVGDIEKVDELLLADKIANYRAFFLTQYYVTLNEIPTQFAQVKSGIESQIINSSNDPRLKNTSISLSKFNIDMYVSLPNDMGIISVRTWSNQVLLNKTTEDYIFNAIKTKDSIIEGELFYWIKGFELFTYPKIERINTFGFLNNPLDGTIYENGAYRQMNIEDPYPIDGAMFQQILIEILSKDYQLEKQNIGDIIQDYIKTEDLIGRK